MHVYFVGPPGSDFATFCQQMSGKRVLYSYATCHGMDVPEEAAGYCLDSGAYTVWKRGRRIDIDRLMAWYERHDTADFKFALDVIGGTEEQQKENLHILEKNGHSVVPVFHGPGLESWEWFDELCEKYPIVAVGSVLRSNASAAAERWLRQIFDRICDKQTGKPRVKIHGLRMCTRMSQFPFHSVDGATWAIAAKNGYMPSEKNPLRQIKAPRHLGRRELQQMWIDAWTNAAKCDRYIPQATLF